MSLGVSPAVSRKSSRDTSNTQLFYVTRSLFKRNRELVDKLNRVNPDYLTPNKKEAAKFNREPHLDEEDLDSDSYKFRRNSTNTSFDKFFNTSARKNSLRCQENFYQSRQRFLHSREKETLATLPDTEVWKRVHTKEPEIDFSKLVVRPQFIQVGKITDDERRYNNFSFMYLDEKHTPNLTQMTRRNMACMKTNISDQIYDKSYAQKEKFSYHGGNMACLFDFSKEKYQQARTFYKEKRPDEIPKTLLETEQVIKGYQHCFYTKKNQVCDFQMFISRDQPPCSPTRILKDNENFYLQRKKVKYYCSRNRRAETEGNYESPHKSGQLIGSPYHSNTSLAQSRANSPLASPKRDMNSQLNLEIKSSS